jgi:hypothetical protein
MWLGAGHEAMTERGGCGPPGILVKRKWTNNRDFVSAAKTKHRLEPLDICSAAVHFSGAHLFHFWPRSCDRRCKAATEAMSREVGNGIPGLGNGQS